MSNMNISYAYEDGKRAEESNSLFRWNYYENVQVVRNIFTDLSVGKELNYSKVRDLSEEIHSNIDAGPQIIKIMNGVRGLDNYTYFHSINTAIYSMFIAKWLNLPVNEIKKTIESGLLHDIGKVKIPDQILNKKGALTENEIEIIQEHPILGYEMVKHIQEMDPEVKSAVLFHHERLDGSGYPLNLNLNEIGLHARIVAVADVYDAMTSDRVYKKRATPGATYEMFKTVGRSLFDEKIVDILVHNIPAYYAREKVFR